MYLFLQQAQGPCLLWDAPCSVLGLGVRCVEGATGTLTQAVPPDDVIPAAAWDMMPGKAEWMTKYATENSTYIWH